ncbi:uncharacterized protein LOC131146648 [Malania oleifera]|uniref:uncharacterized protein LOC131146648 n=1 Tax=Malania oleifera TaxID=397392 RepID=UPI0025AE33CF|nr:uncharacterized protein LOC131146648 [Malania oleifera]
MELENSSIPMEKPGKIMRRSIHTFLQHYQYFTSTPALLVFPFSASVLLSQALVPSTSSLLPTIHRHLLSLFDAAGFPPNSEFFSLLNLKLSQTISSSIFTLPFTLSFHLLAKATIIQALHYHKPTCPSSFSSLISTYNSLLLTLICNSFLILSANATAFSILFLAFNCLEEFGTSSPKSIFFLSASGAVLYSIILANALLVCNLALVSSGMDKCGGYLAILKACVMIRGRASTALSLALPTNLALAAAEALFQYRVVRPYHFAKMPISSAALEGVFIAYLYSILIVLDTVVACIFFKSCKMGSGVDQEGRYSYRIEIVEEDGRTFANLKNLEEEI